MEHVKTPRPTQAERPKRQELRMPSAKASRTKYKTTKGEPPQEQGNNGRAAPSANEPRASRPKSKTPKPS